MSGEVSFSAEAFSLENAIKRKRNVFPIVVKASESLDTPTRQLGLDHMGEPRLEPDANYLLQQLVKVEFVHVRILRYGDERAMTKTYGGEFVADHDNFIDREFLIPKKFPGKLKVVHRPRSTSTYRSTLQVHEDFPHYIKLEAEATCDKTTGKNRVLPKGSNLELTGKSHKYIECVDRSNPVGPTFKFHMNTQLACSPVADTRVYTLQTLIQIALPKVIEFETIPVSEMSMVLDDEKENMRCMTSGPIEVLGCVHKELIVSWTRIPNQSGYKAVLVPIGRWSKELVLVGNFRSVSEKRAYIDENFAVPTKTTFLQRSFYMTSTDDQTITELIEVASDTSYGDCEDSGLYEMPIEDQQPGLSPDRSPDCMASVYTFNSPTKPPVYSSSAAGTAGKKTTKGHGLGPIDVMGQIAKKAEWFRHIHKDIKIVFKLREKTANNQTSENKAAYGRVVEDAIGSQQSNRKTNSKPTYATKPEIKPKPTKDSKPKVVTPSSQNEVKSKTLEKRMDKRPKGQDKYMYSPHSAVSSTSPPDGEYEQVELGGAQSSDQRREVVRSDSRKAGKKHSRDTQDGLKRRESEKQERRYANDTTFKDVQAGDGYVNRAAVSAYLSPVSDNNYMEFSRQEAPGYDYPDVRGFKKTGTEQNGPGYSQISGIDLKSIARKNQTRDDFYNYSVNELQECFKMCKLKDFADACFEDGLDGKFFESFEFGQLKGEPFNLTDFQITKVKKIINDGWRPNYEF